jgi:hypothetical protein
MEGGGAQQPLTLESGCSFLCLERVGDGLFPGISYFMELLPLAVNNIVAWVTYALVYALTTIGSVPAVRVLNDDQVVAPILLRLVRTA